MTLIEIYARVGILILKKRFFCLPPFFFRTPLRTFLMDIEFYSCLCCLPVAPFGIAAKRVDSRRGKGLGKWSIR